MNIYGNPCNTPCNLYETTATGRRPAGRPAQALHGLLCRCAHSPNSITLALALARNVRRDETRGERIDDGLRIHRSLSRLRKSEEAIDPSLKWLYSTIHRRRRFADKRTHEMSTRRSECDLSPPIVAKLFKERYRELISTRCKWIEKCIKVECGEERQQK